MTVPLSMNHAMIYSRDVARSLPFYRDLLGFELLEVYRAGESPVYARLRVPGSESTIALHAVEPGQDLQPGAVRLYFEVNGLAAYCRKLEKAGAVFSKPPALMPWGWRHAYLDDPDGHEISLYSAGPKRLRKAKDLP
jgi:catechol 2,3-dioxygenase-like lactoylglutathione lyase family enzyme